MVPFEEGAYREYMNSVVKSWLETDVHGGTFISSDDTHIQYYYAMSEEAKATIVMVHGFCEFFGKYHEVFRNFYEEGYNVFFLEQKGHGLSERRISRDYLVHVDDFGEYVEDLKCFMDQIVYPMTENDKHILYCHSMGGAVGTLFLERYPRYFSAAVLSSPMLKMRYAGVPEWQVKALDKLASLLHWGKRPMPGAAPFDPEKPDFENSAASSQARYEYQFMNRVNGQSSYTMNGGTYGWVNAATRATEELRKKAGIIKVPVLILQAGLDDWVDNAGQDEVAGKMRHCELRHFPKAKHEIYNGTEESLKKYYSVIFRFFTKQIAE